MPLLTMKNYETEFIQNPVRVPISNLDRHLTPMGRTTPLFEWMIHIINVIMMLCYYFTNADLMLFYDTINSYRFN